MKITFITLKFILLLVLTFKLLEFYKQNEVSVHNN